MPGSFYSNKNILVLGGLHSTVVVSKRKFKRDSRKDEVVQVLNSANNHWVAISTLGCSVGVVHWLDSIHCGPSSQLKVIVSDLLQLKLGTNLHLNSRR